MNKKTIFSTLLCLFGVAAMADLTYRSGLIQTKIDKANDVTTALDPASTERTPGPVMANLLVSSDAEAATKGYYNEWTGNTTYYNAQNTTFGYAGQIYCEAGKTYTFGKYIDDMGYIKINGTVLINNSGWQDFKTGSFTPTETGWYDIELRCGDGNGGKGPTGGNWPGMGFGYNTINQTGMTPFENWILLECGDSLSLFRCTSDEIFAGVQSLEKTETGYSFGILAGENAPIKATILLGESAGELGDASSWSIITEEIDIASGELGTFNVEWNSETSPIFVVRATGSYKGGFEQWTEPVAAAPYPSVSLDVKDISYTNVTFVAQVDSLGMGSTSADLIVELSTEENFSSIVLSTPLVNVEATGLYDIPLGGMTTNEVYYARIVATGSSNAEATSEQITFQTLLPGTPVVSSVLNSLTFDTISMILTCTDFGVGSDSVTTWFDISESENFETFMTVQGESFTTVPSSILLSIDNLKNGTTYYTRTKCINPWGVEGYSQTLVFTTRIEPVLMSDISAVTSGTTANVSIASLEVVDGASYSVLIKIDEKEISYYENQTSLSRFTATYENLKAGTIHNISIIVKSVLDGVTYEKTYNSTLSVGNNIYTPSSLAEMDYTYVNVGDKITLPALTSSFDYYIILDSRNFKMLADNRTLEATEPGFSNIGIMRYNAATGTHTLDSDLSLAICIPTPAGKGKVYIAKSSTNDIKWGDANSWINATDGVAGYPSAIDDVAIVPVQVDKSMIIDTDVTVGEIYFGYNSNTRAGVAVNGKDVHRSIRLAGVGSSAPVTLTFAKSTKEPALLRYCNLGDSTTTSSQPHIALGHGSNHENRMAIEMQSDLNWDVGSYLDWTDTNLRDRYGRYRCYTGYMRYFNIPEGKTLTIYNVTGYCGWGDTQRGNAAFTLGSGMQFTGKGDFLYEGPGSTCTDIPFFAFEGRVIVRNKQKFAHFAYAQRGGSFNLRNPGLESVATNATLIIEGNGEYLNHFDISQTFGAVATGSEHGYGAPGPHANPFPQKGLIFNGGALLSDYITNGWVPKGYFSTPWNFDKLVVSNGFCMIEMRASGNADTPTNTFNFASVRKDGNGVIQVRTSRMYNSYNKSLARDYVFMKGLDEYAIGGTGKASYSIDVAAEANIVDSNAPIVPWLISPVQYNQSLRFLSVAEDGVLVAPGHITSKAIASVTDPTENVRTHGTNINLTEDITVNSLIVEANHNKGTALGEGRTLTITSGGLILGSDSVSRIDTVDTYNAGTRGTIVFPNKAYIYTARNSDSEPNEIWSKLVSAKGAVFSFPCDLILGGDQTGIDEFIAINSTDLRFGSRDGSTGTIIDVPVHLYGGNSRLTMLKEGSFCTQNLYFHDHGTPGSKFVPVAGTVEKVGRLFIDDVNMPRGTYGSSQSDAEFIDDNHFSGTGVVKVMFDDVRAPTIIFLK